jgi:hypothetical protein
MLRSLLLLFPLMAGALAGARTSSAQTLRGSPWTVDRTYEQARDHELTFFRNARAVREAAREGTLVKLKGNASYRVHQVSYPYVLPATRTFVTRLAAQYRAYCGEKMVVTSGVRPTSFRLINSVDKSVHPAGMAVDIRKPRRARCARWLRQTLLSLEGEGVIDATEERRPPHFHVAVYPRPYTRYVGGTPTPRTEPANSAPERKVAPRAAVTSPHTYRVRGGDTLWSIARRHRTSVERIKEANGMRSERIVAGQRLVIPSR